ncbi:chloride channel protein, partial [bacterium]|nr:chloride channel protein [bacterium]
PSIFGVGYGLLSEELQGGLPIKVLMMLGACKLAATLISYSSGSSGGIFGPSLYIGGMIGGGMGILTQSVLGDPSTQPGAFALVGMGAVFAGIVRAPVTSIIIIFEMTRNYAIILPLMIANITSYLLATRLSPTPIYDALLLQDEIHLHRERGLLLRSLRPGLTVRLQVEGIEDLFVRLVGLVAQVAPQVPRDETVRGLLDRERLFPTALGHGVAVPHAYSRALSSRLCVIAQVPDGVDFGAPDGAPVRLVFLLLSPLGDAQGHLVALAEIARLAWDPETRARLMAASHPSELLAVVRDFNPLHAQPAS